jgi:hypothetical protein
LARSSTEAILCGSWPCWRQVSKQLKVSKSSYNTLVRQYMDQCASAEKHCTDLHNRQAVAGDSKPADTLSLVTWNAPVVFGIPMET